MTYLHTHIIDRRRSPYLRPPPFAPFYTYTPNTPTPPFYHSQILLHVGMFWFGFVSGAHVVWLG